MVPIGRTLRLEKVPTATTIAMIPWPNRVRTMTRAAASSILILNYARRKYWVDGRSCWSIVRIVVLKKCSRCAERAVMEVVVRIEDVPTHEPVVTITEVVHSRNERHRKTRAPRQRTSRPLPSSQSATAAAMPITAMSNPWEAPPPK